MHVQIGKGASVARAPVFLPLSHKANQGSAEASPYPARITGAAAGR
jgi:hypothetical protein